MSSVVCRDLVKIYKTGEVEVIALRGLNMEVRPGELRVIVGRSGSGKTTLLNLIGGIDRPSAGQVIVDDINVANLPEKKLVEYRRKHVGFVFQFFNLIPTFTALENVELPMILAEVPREKRKQRARELLKLVGLEDRMHHRPDQLSGGEQQRVAIAAALANDPPLILADEPTGELDTVTSRRIAELFKKLNKELGKTIIIVTHDISIAKIADRISRISDGVILETITPAELELAPRVERTREEIIHELLDKKEKLEKELNALTEQFKAGKVEIDDYLERASQLRRRIKDIEEEIKKYTI